MCHSPYGVCMIKKCEVEYGDTIRKLLHNTIPEPLRINRIDILLCEETRIKENDQRHYEYIHDKYSPYTN